MQGRRRGCRGADPTLKTLRTDRRKKADVHDKIHLAYGTDDTQSRGQEHIE